MATTTPCRNRVGALLSGAVADAANQPANGDTVANELILVVEDNDHSRKLVRDVLTFKGYQII
jgi:hypothetical protein